MTTLTNQCEDCGRLGDLYDTRLVPYPHSDGGTVLLPQCVDRKACALAAAAEQADCVGDALDEVREQAAALADARSAVKAAEADLSEVIRSALGSGASVLDLAKAAGLSRERIYQIRDGRR